MELGGKSLADLVKDYTDRKVLMPREDVYRVMEDIASALEMMHNHEGGRTAHGDVKMENILMDADGHIKLCDFGAAESEDVSVSRSVISQLYVSPERMESETGAATCEADVWSLGVVLYWLLFGEPPFTSKNPAQLIRAISSFKATMIPNSCGEEERALLMRMLNPCVEIRMTCRQLCLGKAFRCIVNTPGGVWKLKDEEVKELSTQLAEVRSRQLQIHQQLPSVLAKPTAWVGTESLQTLDRKSHRLTPTTLTQIIAFERGWRTAFTFPIDEGEWELKIRASENTYVGVIIGFLRHPLPEDATQWTCVGYDDGIAGAFELWNGRMWKGGEDFPPPGTNKKCNQIGQTAAIRVNMTTREARLCVDDEEQPGIFPDIPSPLCLGISTQNQYCPVDVLHLARTDIFQTEQDKHTLSVMVRMKTLEEEKLKAEEKIARMGMMLRPVWNGTESLQTLDRTAHRLTPTTLTQIIVTPNDNPWRTVFTNPIDEGEWELKIRTIKQSFLNVMLGFHRHPLPEHATKNTCGQHLGEIGGEFHLWSGAMWKGGGEFKPIGTNKKCVRVGQTAAIRVNMLTREVRLFVDDEEQPGIFTDIPSPLCLAISTGFTIDNQCIEVVSLKRI
ncbi:putative Protein kinase domain containing protein [Blattamonas nauphoetae]|uniref:Protein kinase domain-containing protein n=1 Tax=Blattamonas nauphoetae TaxID=2049346 RepID=A0ABQ9X6G7_9EUKA|nr:putative Protein kinase domain containing protein [Blattamonas nauphoetae]